MREFIDEHHAIENKYYKIMDGYTGKNVNSIITRLKKIIPADPDYFETYNSLQDLLNLTGNKDEANLVIKQASERALNKIVD